MFSSKKKYVTVKKGQQVNIDGQCWNPNYARLRRVLRNILQALRSMGETLSASGGRLRASTGIGKKLWLFSLIPA